MSLDRRLEDALELREQPLPSPAHWEAARERGDRMFGVPTGELLGASNVGALIERIREELKNRIAGCRQFAEELGTRLQVLKLDLQGVPRFKTALAVVSVGEALIQASDDVFVERLGTASAPTSWEAMGAGFKQADVMAQALHQTRWETLENAWSLTGQLAEAASALRQRTVSALSNDELTEALAPALRAVEVEANGLIRKALEKTAKSSPTGDVPPPPPGRRIVDTGDRQGLTASGLRDLMGELERMLEDGHRSASVQWRIEEEEPRP